MKLINLLIRELDNCSLGGDFRVSCHAEICQFDRFSLEINFKRARSCNYGIPRLVQVKMKILYKQTITELQFEIKTKGYNPIDVQLVTLMIYLSFAKL